MYVYKTHHILKIRKGEKEVMQFIQIVSKKKSDGLFKYFTFSFRAKECGISFDTTLFYKTLMDSIFLLVIINLLNYMAPLHIVSNVPFIAMYTKASNNNTLL